MEDLNKNENNVEMRDEVEDFDGNLNSNSINLDENELSCHNFAAKNGDMGECAIKNYDGEIECLPCLNPQLLCLNKANLLNFGMDIISYANEPLTLGGNVNEHPNCPVRTANEEMDPFVLSPLAIEYNKLSDLWEFT